MEFYDRVSIFPRTVIHGVENSFLPSTTIWVLVWIIHSFSSYVPPIHLVLWAHIQLEKFLQGYRSVISLRIHPYCQLLQLFLQPLPLACPHSFLMISLTSLVPTAEHKHNSAWPSALPFWALIPSPRSMTTSFCLSYKAPAL